MAATSDSDFPTTDAYRILDTPMLSMRDFLKSKVEMGSAPVAQPATA